ncbi:MAG: sugar transferase [Bacteroidales bacterium]|nr:sugar transferase [Bacteroidales bacterium]
MERRQKIRYIVSDTLAAILAWLALFLFRKLTQESLQLADINSVFTDRNFWLGLVFVPLGWLALYTIQGQYRNVLRRSRLKELTDTAMASIIGVVVIFFSLLIDDNISTYRNYYSSFSFLLLVHFTLTYILRLIITTGTVKKIQSRRIGFPTLMVGSKKRAHQTYLDLENQETYSGNLFVGFVDIDGQMSDSLKAIMPHLGNLNDIKTIIETNNVQEVIVAIEDNEYYQLKEILLSLSYHDDLIIKVTPDARDLIIGSAKVDAIFHSPLIVLNNRLMKEWQYSVKRIADIVISLLALIILSPVFLITAIIIKLSSPGPVFYVQERIGYHGKPFKMHKFRSMYIDAERSGPTLSKDNDPRITPFGRFMRKVRLDEIPQFYNVLKGTMSLVGPRPERQFFIDQILTRAPEYLLLQRVKPGITSWGQVKYGYASNVDEMVERLKYDLLYLDNMSLQIDIKILLYTIIIVIQGRGK